MKSLLHTLFCTCFFAASMLVSSSVLAGPILFAMVSDMTEDYEATTNSYVAQGKFIRDLWAAGHTGTVDTLYLNRATGINYEQYSQIFVYDLASNLDNTANQMANYSAIADWYSRRVAQNLILDGRIISSTNMYTDYMGLGDQFGEPEFINNYRVQMELRGGGLVLGTDHFNFADGINNINQLIGVGAFTGTYFPCTDYSFTNCSSALEAYVDPSSPLYVPDLEDCESDASGQWKCINDNSSSSFVAAGLQANGQFLNPVAWHGGYGNSAGVAVSTTMGGLSPLACAGMGQQLCAVTISEPMPLALLVLGLAGMQLRRRFSPALKVQAV